MSPHKIKKTKHETFDNSLENRIFTDNNKSSEKKSRKKNAAKERRNVESEPGNNVSSARVAIV